ncbi:MAG: hypothetical protein AAF988_05715 [Pseudomonadota bacterium]
MKQKKRNIFWLVILSGLLQACGNSTGINLGPYYEYGPTKNNFNVCHGYSCRYQTAVEFSDKEWDRLLRPLKRSFSSAEAERTSLAKVIGNIEKLAGQKSGTSGDLAEARGKPEDAFQMDCIDETINHVLYMKFIRETGLLKKNVYVRPVHRGYFVDGSWPHNAVLVRDLETEEMYVFDAFYKANGKPPYIVPYEEWKAGWRPNKNLQGL